MSAPSRAPAPSSAGRTTTSDASSATFCAGEHGDLRAQLEQLVAHLALALLRRLQLLHEVALARRHRLSPSDR